MLPKRRFWRAEPDSQKSECAFDALTPLKSASKNAERECGEQNVALSAFGKRRMKNVEKNIDKNNKQ
jgi:hypothetical protein